MESAAASPEELETLLEDALLLYDVAAVQALFESGLVRVACVSGSLEGSDAGELLAERGFIASGVAMRVCPDVAVGAGSAVTVAHRGADRRWRLLVVVVHADVSRT
jgi:hypothetical protein